MTCSEQSLSADDPIEFERLSPAERAALLLWITLAVRPAAKRHYHTSYGLKHDYQRDSGLYVVNGAFKGAMVAAGYKPTHTPDQNWLFRIKPACPSRGRCMHKGGSVFGMWHISDEERELFDTATRLFCGSIWSAPRRSRT